MLGHEVCRSPAKTKRHSEDLYNVPENGKAELVNGELLIMEPTGFNGSVRRCYLP
jgi:hypothetical protein